MDAFFQVLCLETGSDRISLALDTPADLGVADRSIYGFVF